MTASSLYILMRFKFFRSFSLVVLLVSLVFFSQSGVSANAQGLEGNLSGHWRFDGGYNDYSEGSNSLTRRGTSLYFDGEDDWVDVDIEDSPDWEYTLAVWVKPQDKTSRMIFRRAHCSALYLDSSNVRMYFKRSDHNADSITVSNDNIQENQWNFIAASVNLNDSSAKMFVNGVENTKSIDIDNTTDLMPGGGNEDFIGGGGQLNGCPNPGFFQGWIDHIQFYENSLSLDQMQEVYENGKVGSPRIGFWPISSGSGEVVKDYSSNNYDGEIVKGNNLLNNSGFESGGDSTGNMDRIRTNYAGSSWVSDYSLYGNYSGRHNKTGEDDQWSAVEWSLSTLNTSTEYVFSSWYKCSGDAEPTMNIRIFNGTGWFLEDTTVLDYKCNGRWDRVTGRVGSEVSVLQDTNKFRFQWDYSTNPGQMFVDNISLRRDGPEWSSQGFSADSPGFTKGILGTKSADFTSFDSYLTGSKIDLEQGFSISAWFKPDGDKIGTRNNPGNSCLHILENGGSEGNGVYWIDPEDSSAGKFKVFCDMETDGGGWTLVGSYADGSFFDDCSNSNVDLKYGNSCSTLCSEFTDDGSNCDTSSEKSIQDAEMERLEDKYVIEKEYGAIGNRNSSDYVSPAYSQLGFEETMFKDEYGDFVSYNFSKPDSASMNNLNYTLSSMSDFYRSANTHQLQLRFQSSDANINPAHANDCGNLELGIMAADNDGGSVDYYTSGRKYTDFSRARAGPIWDSANNGGCRFDDASGRWSAKRLGGQKNTQSQYISWFVRESEVARDAGVSQEAYSISSSNKGVASSLSSSKSLIFEDNLRDWMNLVFVYDNETNTQKLFVDGVLRSQSSSNALGGFSSLSIGKFFKGRIDEVRIYNRSLSRANAARLAFS